MKIVLLNARIGNSPSPPLGILYLAAVLRDAGHTVMALDPDPHRPPPVNELAAFDPDLAGISIMTTQVRRARELATAIREHAPRAVIIGGGIHPTALPEWSLRNLDLDYAVIGEGEHTVVELCRILDSGGDPASVAGIAFLDAAGICRRTPPRQYITDLDELPLPARDLLDFERYLRPPGNIRGVFLRRATAIMCGRGCPFSCTFCASHRIFGRAVRLRSIDNVLDELGHLVRRHAIDGFWLLDDTLLEDHDWTTAFCRRLREKGYHLTWGCQGHVRRIREPVLREMKAAGCVQIEFGVESGSPRILRRLRKGTDPDDIKRAFMIARRVGLRTLANFMIGNPDETEDDLEMTFRLAKVIRPDHVVATFTTPLPGSTLYEEAIARGWIETGEDFSGGWVIRQTENPAVRISLDPSVMKRFRTKFDNHFFLTNHLDYLLQPELVLDIGRAILRNPGPYLAGFLMAIRTKRLSHFFETVWNEYNAV
ncbi:B12-binding domain-containing radical SAM protein [bacterium]|nr:B12-binding domain-containing radical SAM protein [candidate division CSSED10-310 bacterium]